MRGLVWVLALVLVVFGGGFSIGWLLRVGLGTAAPWVSAPICLAWGVFCARCLIGCVLRKVARLRLPDAESR